MTTIFEAISQITETNNQSSDPPGKFLSSFVYKYLTNIRKSAIATEFPENNVTGHFRLIMHVQFGVFAQNNWGIHTVLQNDTYMYDR